MPLIRLKSTNGIWDLVLSAPCVYRGDGVYEVSDFTIKVLKRKKIEYEVIEK